MPKGKVKSFLAVNDIFKLAMKSLLGKGWENLPQSEKPLLAPSLFIQAGAWLQRATSDGCGGTQLYWRVLLSWVSISPGVPPGQCLCLCHHTEAGDSLHGLISAALRIPTAAREPGCLILLCLLFLSTSSRNLLHVLLDLEEKDI